MAQRDDARSAAPHEGVRTGRAGEVQEAAPHEGVRTGRAGEVQEAAPHEGVRTGRAGEVQEAAPHEGVRTGQGADHGVHIERGSPHDPQVAALFALSDAYAASLYPAESNHLVDADLLAQAHVIFCVARRGEQILGCGASVLGPDYAEIKRMFVLEEARGLRLGERILAYLEEQTAARGVRVLRLETGIHSHPARRLYERCGYRLTGPFADYWDDPLSVFYEKTLP